MTDGTEESILDDEKGGNSSENSPTSEVEKQRAALETAENKLDRQLQLSRDIESKAIQFIKVNLFVLGALVTAISISPSVLRFETIVGAVLLASALLSALLPLTPEYYKIGITSSNLEEREEYDTASYLSEVVDKYGDKIEANKVALSNELLGISPGRWLDISLALTMAGFTSFAIGFVNSSRFIISDIQAILLVGSFLFVTLFMARRALRPALSRVERIITERGRTNDMASEDEEGGLEDEEPIRKRDDEESE